MANLLMISGHGASHLDRQGAFYNTLEEFHKHWDRIDIICPKGGKEAQYFGNIYVHPSPWPLIFQPLWILKKGAQIFREHRFSVVTAHDYPPFYNGIGARWLHRHTEVPYMSEIMHVPGYPRGGNLKEQIYKHLTKLFVARITRMAGIVRVINQDTLHFLRTAGVKKEQLKLIPAMYIDTDVFRPMEVSKVYDLIFVGRLEENKGIAPFLDAVRESTLRAIIVGDGPLKSMVQEYISSHTLGGRITCHGWARDSHEVARLINQSRILVMPSYNEGGPRVVLEAMACGVPVVATRVGIVPDIVPPEQQCDWTADDIAAKIGRLLDDSVAYARASAVGRNIAGRFEKASAITRYADALKTISH